MTNNHVIQGSALAINDQAIIIIGASGSGKSDLALRLIDRGAQLIADDLITITGQYDNPIASQTEHHIPAIEVRGLGIIPMNCVNDLPLKLIVETSDNYQRIAAPLPLTNYGDYSLPTIKISAWEISAAIKVEIALHQIDTLTNADNS